VTVCVDHPRYQRRPAAIDDLGVGWISFLSWSEPLNASILDQHRQAELQLRRRSVRERQIANQQPLSHAGIVCRLETGAACSMPVALFEAKVGLIQLPGAVGAHKVPRANVVPRTRRLESLEDRDLHGSPPGRIVEGA
jgi:hypothetical protein